MVECPIWKDFYANLGSDESAIYQIRIPGGNEIIYTGKAFKRPGQSMLTVRINDICADYLETPFPDINNPFNPLPFPKQFDVDILEDGYFALADDVLFYNDWSYDRNYDPYTDGLSCPVNGKVSPLTPIPYSLIWTEELNVIVNGQYTESIRPDGSGSAGIFMVDVSARKGGDIVKLIHADVGDREYHVVDPCARYAFYYVNAYGGVDMLLMEGHYSKVDNLTRHSRQVEYDNRDVSSRGVHNYQNEISKAMTLHTSWLSDAEAERMHHLLNSTNVYLYDIEKGEMIPVTITDTTTEYKTYKGNGGKLVNYAINVVLSQERMRR